MLSTETVSNKHTLKYGVILLGLIAFSSMLFAVLNLDTSPTIQYIQSIGIAEKVHNNETKTEYKSCIHRLTDCEGSFEFSPGHFKHRKNALAYLYRNKPVDWYLRFDTNNDTHLHDISKDCLINFDPFNVGTNRLTGAEIRWNTIRLKPQNGGDRAVYKYTDPIRLFNYILIYYHLYPLTYDNRSPFFIELGAYDGIWTSNTLSLEVCLNWNGLLIDGNVLLYTKLMDNRPFINKLLLVPGCTTDNTSISFSNSVYTSGGVADIVGDGSFVNPVHCGPLSLYLKDLDIDSINYFSLDVEGSENFVLQTIDFEQTKIDVFQIETRNRLCGDAKCAKVFKLRNFMNQKGYNLIMGYTNADDLYVHPKSKICVFVLKRIEQILEIVKSSGELTYFGDEYLYQNYHIIQNMCTFKFSKFENGQIVEIADTSLLNETFYSL